MADDIVQIRKPGSASSATKSQHTTAPDDDDLQVTTKQVVYKPSSSLKRVERTQTTEKSTTDVGKPKKLRLLKSESGVVRAKDDSTDILEKSLATIANAGSRSVPQTPVAGFENTGGKTSAATQPSARAIARTQANEQNFFADKYEEGLMWIALTKLAENFIATTMTAETAVDFSRAVKPQET